MEDRNITTDDLYAQSKYDLISITVPDRGGRISSCGLAARRLSWNVTVRVWNGNQRGR